MQTIDKTRVHQGWLHKQSRFLRRWRPRFAVLTSTHFLTYDREEANNEPTEVFILRHCFGVKSCDDETNKEHSFRIDYSGKVFYFFCQDKTEKDKWIGSISKAGRARAGGLTRRQDDDQSVEKKGHRAEVLGFGG